MGARGELVLGVILIYAGALIALVQIIWLARKRKNW